MTLYEDSWHLFQKMTFLGPVFSLHPTVDSHCLLAVTSTACNNFMVTVVERERILLLAREEECPCPVERLIPLLGGQFLLLDS